MKKITPLVLLLATVAMGFTVVDNIITRLGMEERSARWYIMNNVIGRFSSGPINTGQAANPTSVYEQMQSFKIPRARLLPDIIAGDKSGAAAELCAYLKEYVESASFITEYNRLREDAMPLMDKGATLGSLRKNAEVYQTNINNYKNDTKYVAEQEKLKAETQQRIDALLAQAAKPFDGKELWLKMYPADPAVIIKQRLQEYLAVAATVDFNAKLTGTGRRQTFVNATYEKKSLKWKAVYRAGKEVNDVITSFIKEWLKAGIVTGKPDKIVAEEKKTATIQPVSNSSNTANPAATSTTVTPPAAEQKQDEKAPTNKTKKSLFNKIKEKVKMK